MDDNLPAANATFALPGASILAIEGPDAVKFAQAQFMSDVSALADGDWHWSGWLTPKGRLVALFALLRIDSQSLWLLLPDAPADGLREALQRYVFRSKLALAVREDLHVAGAFSLPATARGARFSIAADGAVELDLGTPGAERTVSIGSVHAPVDEGAAVRWTVSDLEHGLPRLDPAQSGQWTPQQLSLDRLNAYSVKKGCYPGQEIVARTHFLGQAKRGLALFEANASIPPGSEVHDGGRAIGTVVSSAGRGNGDLLLAVVPLDADTTALRAVELPLAPRALLDGLAR